MRKNLLLLVTSIFLSALAHSEETKKFATGLVFSVLDKEVKSLDGKSTAQSPVQTVISTQGGDKDGQDVKIVKTLSDENGGNKTPIVEQHVKIYESRELALSKKPQGAFGFYLKDEKSFVVICDTCFGKSAVLYRERKDGHLDSQTVNDWKALVEIAPVNPDMLKDKGTKNHERAPAVEKK